MNEAVNTYSSSVQCKVIVSLRFVTLYGMATLVAEDYNSAPLLDHSREILNGIHVAVEYNVTNRKLSIVDENSWETGGHFSQNRGKNIIFGNFFRKSPL